MAAVTNKTAKPEEGETSSTAEPRWAARRRAAAVGVAGTAEPRPGRRHMARKKKTTARLRASLKRKVRKRQERNSGHKRVRGTRKRK